MSETLFTDICEYGGHEWTEIVPLYETKQYLYVSIDRCDKCNINVEHSRYKYMVLEDKYYE